jgi:hypothetical protein
VYRFWRDLGYAAGAVVAGLLAGAFGLSTTVLAGDGLTLASGLLAARWITGTRQVTLAAARGDGSREGEEGRADGTEIGVAGDACGPGDG